MARAVRSQIHVHPSSLLRLKDLTGTAIQGGGLPGASADYQAKARWIIRDNLVDKDFMESYIPVVTEQTNKLLLALTAIKTWKARKGDVTLAFLNGKIFDTSDTKIYMSQPLGYEADDRQSVWLYGIFASKMTSKERRN